MAANLSVALAQSCRNVALLDTDMRRPAVHRRLRLSNRRGLSDLFVQPMTELDGALREFDRALRRRQADDFADLRAAQRFAGDVGDVDTALELIDLPGTFSLSAHSMEERIAVDVVLAGPDAVVTHVAIAVAIRVGLVWIGVRRAVVARVAEPVSVAVGVALVLGPHGVDHGDRKSVV